ncbi:hypothetical protein PINS_up005768 [Pythium insidiosum]|nr:hypothetical protein PINS_up005768 [Pythium insidiosum]
MGCKPYKSWEDWLKDHPEDNEESEEVDDDECDDDETEMSVEGVEGIFCVAGQACVANTNGTCPEPQDGLEFGAYCGKVKSGVLGCKPYKSEAERKGGSAEDEAAHQVCEGSHEEGGEGARQEGAQEAPQLGGQSVVSASHCMTGMYTFSEQSVELTAFRDN